MIIQVDVDGHKYATIHAKIRVYSITAALMCIFRPQAYDQYALRVIMDEHRKRGDIPEGATYTIVEGS